MGKKKATIVKRAGGGRRCAEEEKPGGVSQSVDNGVKSFREWSKTKVGKAVSLLTLESQAFRRVK